MKKILFNDKYGLTKAVLEGRKTMTRRIINNVIVTQELNEIDEDGDIGRSDTRIIIDRFSSYKVGEVVAVAQSYKSLNEMGYIAPEWCAHSCEDEENPAYGNKMFVLAELMPHHIRITNVRVERLQDISDEDCFCEGIFRFNLFHRERYAYTVRRKIGDDETIVEFKPFDSPREAFASLIDKLSGKGTWENNPLVYVYEFELVK